MQWKIAAELPVVTGQVKALGFAGPVAGVYQNRLIVAGGSNFPDSMPWLGGKKKYFDELFIYEKKGNRIVRRKKSFNLPFTVAYAASCSTANGVVYAGGENEQGISNKVFNLQINKNATALHVQPLPDLPVAVTNASATVYENTIYVAGGETATAASDLFLALDLDHLSNGWKRLPPVPKAVSHAVLVVQKNDTHESIYLIGGRSKNASGISDLYSSVFEFNLTKNQWTVKKSLPYELSAGTGMAAGAESILLFGGDKGETFHQAEMLIAAIQAEKSETVKAELNRKKILLQSSHPGFSKEVLLYNTRTDEWKEAGFFIHNSPVTTTAVQWGNRIVIPGGEIKAGVRSPYILSGKLQATIK